MVILVAVVCSYSPVLTYFLPFAMQCNVHKCIVHAILISMRNMQHSSKKPCGWYAILWIKSDVYFALNCAVWCTQLKRSMRFDVQKAELHESCGFFAAERMLLDATCFWIYKIRIVVGTYSLSHYPYNIRKYARYTEYFELVFFSIDELFP